MNPENKFKLMLDSNFGLQCLVAMHKSLGACIFEVDVVAVLCPQFKYASLLQALLTNLRVLLSDGLITQLHNSIKGHTSVEENAAVGGHASMEGHVLWWNMLLLGDMLLWRDVFYGGTCCC